MKTSQFIARLIGPVVAVVGIGMLADGAQYRAVVDGFLRSPALIYIAGFLGLLGGLAIVNVHNSWDRGWPLIITVLGWLAIVGGAVRMLAPQIVEAAGAAMMAQRWLVTTLAILLLALGGFLSFKGYSK
jgi:uncharacterized membrane protein